MQGGRREVGEGKGLGEEEGEGERDSSLCSLKLGMYMMFKVLVRYSHWEHPVAHWTCV